jgi:hypothetical protein
MLGVGFLKYRPFFASKYRCHSGPNPWKTTVDQLLGSFKLGVQK